MHDAPKALHETPPAAVGSRVELVTAGRYRAAAGHDYPAHYHPALELIVYEAGAITCLLGERCVETRPGTALIIPAGQPHADRARTAYRQLYVQVRHPALERRYRAPRVLADDADGTLAALTAFIVREWQARWPERRMLELLLEGLEILLCRLDADAPASAAEQLVRRAEERLTANLASCSIHALADELGVAPSTLRGHFSRLRGCSPKAHLLALRLRRAVELIRTSSLSLDEIAGLTGYHSASHLSRHVKQATGKTPGACRAAPLEPAPPNLSR